MSKNSQLYKIKKKEKIVSVIEVKNLTKDYGSGRGVFDVSFAVEKGEVFGFLGPNGAGKSTTIRHLMGFSKPQSGETKIFNKDTFDRYFEILKKVGYIPGEIALPQGLTGAEFLKMMQDLQGIHNKERLDYLLDYFKLSKTNLKCETKRMSLGVKRKLAIVASFMSDPDVLILDEPTSGLDIVMQEKFIDFIKAEKARGKTILLSSHIFSEVDATCDRIAIIKDGRIVSQFVADDLKHKTQKFYNVTFVNEKSCKDFVELQEKSDILKVLSFDKNKALISTNDKDINKVIDILSGFHIKEFDNVKETLQDFFMKFYKEDKEFKGI